MKSERNTVLVVLKTSKYLKTPKKHHFGCLEKISENLKKKNLCFWAFFFLTEFSNLDCKVDKIGNDLSELKGEFWNLNYQNRRSYTYSENSPNIINRSDTRRSRTDDERATLSTGCLHPWNLLNFCHIYLTFFLAKSTWNLLNFCKRANFRHFHHKNTY